MYSLKRWGNNVVVEKMISILGGKVQFLLPTGSPNKTGKQSTWLRSQVRTLGGSRAPLEPPVSLAQNCAARTHMCISGSQAHTCFWKKPTEKEQRTFDSICIPHLWILPAQFHYLDKSGLLQFLSTVTRAAHMLPSSETCFKV